MPGSNYTSGQKKMYGTISVNEMAVSGLKMYQSTGIKGYDVNSEIRFNFLNKSHKIPNSNLRRYLDTLMAEKAKIPSPDKYTGQRVNFLDDKRHKIYAHERKFEFADLIKKGKNSPGCTSYNTTQFDEKYVKPPKIGKFEK